MHLKELNHRSPLRVFERSVHGGLGTGNIGVVASRPGVGKTAFLLCLALDDLLRDRKVLHVTTDQTVDHVRAWYEEMFADLAKEAHLEESVVALDKIEHNRFIRSLNGRRFDVASFERSLAMLRTEVSFKPDVVIVDGYDFEGNALTELAALRDVAKEHACEVWMSLSMPKAGDGEDWHETPQCITRLGGLAAVCVLLQPVEGAIRIRLLKDHDNPDVTELALDLDPRTFLIRAT